MNRKERAPLLALSIVAASCAAAAPKEPPPAPTKAAAPATCPPAIVTSAAPKPQEVAPKPTRFTLESVMVPMRDGVLLQTVLLTPKSASKPLPFLFTRSPYGVPGDGEPFKEPEEPLPFEAGGYIFVFQNLRGRFKSEGTFVMSRPQRDKKDPRSVDESTDAYDTIEWLIHNVPNNNGRVGMLGTSYAGWTAAVALLEPHPALKAIAEAAAPSDQFFGDDFHHNGAFRLSYCFEYSALLESDKNENTQFEFDRQDTYEWYLALGPLSNANKRYFHGRVPSWNDFITHPNLDAFWESQDLATYLKKTSIPILNVAGSWDQEDPYGPLKIYKILEDSDRERKNYVVLGPWNHGGWFSPGRTLGDIDFGSDTGKYFKSSIEAPWFARWLHDKDVPARPEAEIFVTGTNQWKSFDHWPPQRGVKPIKLYLRAGKALSFDPPAESGADAADEYVSDPANPVPYTRRPIRPTYQGSEWKIWQVLDQRFVDHRTDVLSYTTDVLDHDVVIAGDIVADLFAATSGTDSDWIVKLIDVYPEGSLKPPKLGDDADKAPSFDMRGYQLMIAGEVMRGRFRKSFARPEPVPAGNVVEYKFDLRSHAHAFLKGHRIMVQVQSTWFPVIDRNPQRYVESIYEAKDIDFVKATQKISRSKQAASAIIMPVLEP